MPFRITRMEGIRATGTTHQNIPAQERLSADEQWNREVSLDLVPHPSHPHPTSIEHDFGMQDGKLTVTLRAAVAGYVLWQWQVDCSPDASLRGPEFRLWLADARQLDSVDNAVLAPGYVKPLTRT